MVFKSKVLIRQGSRKKLSRQLERNGNIACVEFGIVLHYAAQYLFIYFIINKMMTSLIHWLVCGGARVLERVSLVFVFSLFYG